MSKQKQPTAGALPEDKADENRTLHREKKLSMQSRAVSEAPSEAKTVIVEWDPEVTSIRSSTERAASLSPSRKSPPILKGSKDHDGERRVTVASGASETESHDGPVGQERGATPTDRKSQLMRKRSSSRKATELTFDIVVEKEPEPDVLSDLHDLTKEKADAHDLLVKEVTSDNSYQGKDSKKKDVKYTAPWRQHKSASKAKLVEEKMGDQKKFGMQLGDKFWVPTIVNPLEIDLRRSQKKELKEVFEMIENPRAGMVSIDDIWTVVNACGSEPTPVLIDDIVTKIQPRHPGYLVSEEFEEILRYRLQEQDPIEEIERAFKMMSKSRKDRVNLEDLRVVSKLVDYPLSDDELMEMINAAGPTGIGAQKEATLGGFVRLMTSPNWYDTDKPAKRKNERKSPFRTERVYRRMNSSK